jgi:hypothetical protein
MSTLKVNTIQKRSGSAIAIGESGDTVNLTGATNIVGNTAITGTLTCSGTTLGGGSNDGYFMAYRDGTNEGPSAATWTAYVYNATHVNDGSAYNTSNGEYTAPSAGRYFFESQFWASQLDNEQACQVSHYFDLASAGSFTQNTARTRYGLGRGVGTDKGPAVRVGTLVDLAAGDKVKTFVYVDSGGIFANSGYNYFLGYKLA